MRRCDIADWRFSFLLRPCGDLIIGCVIFAADDDLVVKEKAGLLKVAVKRDVKRDVKREEDQKKFTLHGSKQISPVNASNDY